MNISVQVIPHLQQRYNTVGDWQVRDGTLYITVSELRYPNGVPYAKKENGQFVLAVHEMIEAFSCLYKGITEKEVDAFDLDLKKIEEAQELAIEIGDHPDSPYKQPHMLASGVERILCYVFGITWYEYEELLILLEEHYTQTKEDEKDAKRHTG